MLQERLIEDNLMRRHIWQATDVNNLAESFPTLTLDDIRSLTLGIKLLQQKLMKYFLFLGVYQLKRARSYAEENSDTTDLTNPNVDFPVEECTQEGAEDIVRIRFKSAHKISCSYHTYIQFDSTRVIAWYCICPAGAQIIGCCSHVAAAIWFLGYERYQTTITRKPSSTSTTNTHYADAISDFEPSSDDEDNQSLYTLN